MSFADICLWILSADSAADERSVEAHPGPMRCTVKKMESAKSPTHTHAYTHKHNHSHTYEKQQTQNAYMFIDIYMYIYTTQTHACKEQMKTHCWKPHKGKDRHMHRETPGLLAEALGPIRMPKLMHHLREPAVCELPWCGFPHCALQTLCSWGPGPDLAHKANRCLARN